MLNSISGLINKFRDKFINRKPEKPTLYATNAFHCLMTATADALDAREEAIQAGIIDAAMSAEEAIPYLFALNVFYNYEKKYSPIMASNLLRKYCPAEFANIFEFYYRLLAEANEIEISDVDFQSDSFVPFIDIASFASGCVELGHKRHWNPFKEPYCYQWDSSFTIGDGLKVNNNQINAPNQQL